MRRTGSGASLAALGSTLLRSIGSKRPWQQFISGCQLSWCPAARARPLTQAARRFRRRPGAEKKCKAILIAPPYANTVVLN
jgi:hypothetical protein